MTSLKSIEERVENWRDRFDEHFYQKDRVWFSKGGESYGSITPEMGRGELFRFIEKEIKQTLTSDRQEIIEMLGEEKNRFRCAACDGAKCGHTHCCQALSDAILKIKERGV